MSVEIWPPLPANELRTAIADTEARELQWLLDELFETLVSLKTGLADCYALLAPTEPGSTLVISTPRHEAVKGHVTRVGTQIVKGTIRLHLRTLPHLTLNISPTNPLDIAPLSTLHTLISHSIDLLALTLTHLHPPPTSPQSSNLTLPLSNATFIAAQLRLLSHALSDSLALLRGPPLTTSDPSWTSRSASPTNFDPSLSTLTGGAPLSFHLSVQDCQLVLWLRVLEEAAAPVNLGMKLALAIGTARRLEHDEAEREFVFRPSGDGESSETSEGVSGRRLAEQGQAGEEGVVRVFVREKVRVESADPSLLSLSAKLTALGHTLGLARGNLAAVMGEELEE